MKPKRVAGESGLQERLRVITEEESERLFGPKKTKFGTCVSCDQQFPLRGCGVCDTRLTDTCLSCHLELVHDIIDDDVTYRDGVSNEKTLHQLRARSHSLDTVSSEDRQ
jgi:hypothetical protein